MMAGNPSWWSMALPQQHHHQQQQLSPNSLLSSLLGSSSPPNSSSNSLTFTSLSDNNNNYNSSLENLPHNQHHSWSQLVLGGLAGNEEEDTYRGSQSHEYESKKLENWENQQIMNIGSCNSRIDHVKQESNNSNLYVDQEFHRSQAAASSWSQSCVTSNGNSVMDFSYNNKPPDFARVHQVQSPESNSTATETGGACKKPRVSSSQPPLKVRKEKLGDRITALHQLVSPFGKTDTASVLLEAIGYIRFLQSQIEALSSPYLGASASLSSSNIRNHQSVQGERNCVFPEEPGQLLNDICIKAKGAANMQEMQDRPKDLRSRGLCLVPVSCTQHVGSDNGADYWAPAMSGGF